MFMHEALDVQGQNVPMDVVIDDYIEYSHELRSRVIRKVKNGRKIAQREWENIVKRGSVEELGQFYTESNYHYDVLLPYLQPDRFSKVERYQDIIDFVKCTNGHKVMEFGGGPGQLCLLIYFNTGKSVTYLDLPSPIMDFAKWRFEKYSADIGIIEASVDECSLPGNAYDIVISDAVLEHVPKLMSTVRSICRSLKPRGYFYILFDDQEKDLPMHVSSNADIDAVLRNNDLKRLSGPVWIKDPYPCND